MEPRRNRARRPLLARLRLRYPDRFDAVMMLFYTLLVHVWGLGCAPLGRDYAALASGGRDLPFLASGLFQWEMGAFGTWVAGYRLVNILLLYGCLVCLYRLANWSIKGMWWLGTLTALLFMANPTHTESVMNLSGAGDLVPCLAALAALTAYAALVERSNYTRFALAIALFAFAALAYRENAWLFLAVVLYEALVPPRNERGPGRAVAFVAIGLVACVVHAKALWISGIHPQRDIGALYFLLYPLGFLPETARTLHEHPWLGWLGAAAVLVIVYLIHRRARCGAFVFGLTAMAAVRIGQSSAPVDPVHLVGGGQLVLANALFCVALVALFFRIMDHPKWRVTVIGGTTALCIFMFTLEIRAVLAWNEAGHCVAAVRQAAERLASEGRPVALAPDIRYAAGAPMCLAEALGTETRFGHALPVASLVRLDLFRTKGVCVATCEWRPERGCLRVTGAAPIEVAPWPYALSRLGEKANLDGTEARIVDVHSEGFAIELTPAQGSLPAEILNPFALP